MNIKKTLPIFTCLLSSFFNVSCSHPDDSGVNFTYVELQYDVNEPLSTEFSYEGSNLKVYWGDGVEDSLNYHTFSPECENKYFVISGDVTSISFSDENGNLLAYGNSYIKAIIFSNSINTIHDRAFYGIPLEVVIIPTSIRTVGKEAFANFQTSTFFLCGTSSKPDGWDDNWDSNVRFLNIHFWDVIFYIKDSCLFLLTNYAGIKSGIAELYFGDEEEVELDIPNVISNAGNDYIITNIADQISDLAVDRLKKVKIPDNVETISESAFRYCHNLESVEISPQTSHLKLIDRYAFDGTNIKEIVIPKTVCFISDDVFHGCHNLNDVYLTGYAKPSEIAYCDSAFRSNETITFHYSNVLSKEDFYNKGWPEEDGEDYIWKEEPTLLD